MGEGGARARLGLIVNPVAGLGGRVGLKGSDGAETQRRALALGALPQAGQRAVQALDALVAAGALPDVVTYPAGMGEQACRARGLAPTVVGTIMPGPTCADDTRRAAREMLELGIDLLLFAGGDGTARDICSAVGLGVPALGIPAGVKMHSAAFAVFPGAAGELAAAFLQSSVRRCTEAEVMDLDEEAYRQGQVAARLYGYLRVPLERRLVQSGKAPSAASEAAMIEAIAAQVVEDMEPGCLYILGPGTTTRAIADRLGAPKTLVGVDVVADGRLVAEDVAEEALLQLVQGRCARIVVTPIGGQGFIFGRGNQQISPRVIRAVGRQNVIVVSTPGKLAALQGRRLLVDTGDLELDRALAGHARVVTGYREQAVYAVSG